MGKHIPHEMKKRVLDSLFLCIPSNAIAMYNGIGYRSVFRIKELFKSKIPDVDVLRAVAVMIKQEGLSLNDVASSIRIKNFLEQMGSSETEMERLLEEIEIFIPLKQTNLFRILLNRSMKFIDSHRDLEFLFTKSMTMLNIRIKNYELCKLN